MRLQERGVHTVLSLAGSFAAFILMAVAVGTDYWLYSRGVCRTRASSDNETVKRNDEILTHSGLWRMCCMEGARPSEHRPSSLLYNPSSGPDGVLLLLPRA